MGPCPSQVIASPLPAHMGERSWGAHWHVDPPRPESFQGQIFVDGSCTRLLAREMNRAPRSVVLHNGQDVVCR
eukprot:9038600-Pyramimonas_sp.AAC.1